MRLIDADKLYPDCITKKGTVAISQSQIANAPTVDVYTEEQVKELVGLNKKLSEERPQGEWIEGKNGNIKCNQCGCEIRYSYLIGNKPDYPKFCCDCGAEMKGGAEE